MTENEAEQVARIVRTEVERELAYDNSYLSDPYEIAEKIAHEVLLWIRREGLLA